MRFWIIITVALIIISVFIFSAAYMFWVSNGKDIILKHIENLTQRSVTIGDFKITPPFNFQIKNLDIQGLAKVDSVYISSGLLGFLTANIVLNEIKIIKPEIVYEKFAPQALEPSAASGAGAAGPKKKKHPLRLISRRISIKDGKLDFFDHTAGTDGIKITVKDIALNINNLYVFPRSVVANFALKGSIPWQNDSRQGKIILEGWVNFFKKDMQASLKIKDIDGIYLYPYYSQWVDLEKAHIEKAKLDFTSDIQGFKNNVTANCHLELSDIVFKPRPADEPKDKEEKLAAAVLDIFKDLNQGKIALDFTIKTKMDSPDFGFSNIKTAVVDKFSEHMEKRSIKVEHVAAFPGHVVAGTIRGVADVSTAVIGGTAAVIKGLKDAFLSAFRKEKQNTE